MQHLLWKMYIFVGIQDCKHFNVQTIAKVDSIFIVIIISIEKNEYFIVFNQPKPTGCKNVAFEIS